MRQTAIALLSIILAGLWTERLPVATASACTPSVIATTQIGDRDGPEVLSLSVKLEPNASVAGSNRLTRVSFTGAVNAVVQVNGQTRSIPSVERFNAGVPSWSFVVRKVNRGQPFQATYVVTDGCGDVPKFVGVGGGEQSRGGSNPVPSPTPSPAPSPSPTTQPPGASLASIPTSLGFFYRPPRDGTSVQTIVQRFGVAILTRGDEGYRDQLRSAGFRGPVLQYLLANEASRRDVYYPDNVGNIAGDFQLMEASEANFLHNGRGERLYSRWSYWQDGQEKVTTQYLMNPASPAWRAYFVERAKRNIQEARYDGLFLDNLDLTLYRGLHQQDNSDGVVREFSSRETYRAAVVGYLQAIRAELSNVKVWANMTSGWDTPDDWDQYLPYLDGVMEEYFVARWGGTVTSPSSWEAQVKRAEKVVGQGKGFLGVGQGPRSDTSRMRFALASYLLFAANGATFRYANTEGSNQWGDPYAEAWLFDEYGARLGAPTSARYQSGGQWRRDFTCGYVTVDVAGRTGRIVTDSGRQGCS